MPVFDSKSGKANGHTQKHGYKESALTQTLALQALLMQDARNPETTATCRTQIARAFCECEETKRKLKMRPLPGSLKPEPKHKRKPSPIAPSEPLAVVPVAVAPVQPDTMPGGVPMESQAMPQPVNLEPKP